MFIRLSTFRSKYLPLGGLSDAQLLSPTVNTISFREKRRDTHMQTFLGTKHDLYFFFATVLLKDCVVNNVDWVPTSLRSKSFCNMIRKQKIIGGKLKNCGNFSAIRAIYFNIGLCFSSTTHVNRQAWFTMDANLSWLFIECWNKASMSPRTR